MKELLRFLDFFSSLGVTQYFCCSSTVFEAAGKANNIFTILPEFTWSGDRIHLKHWNMWVPWAETREGCRECSDWLVAINAIKLPMEIISFIRSFKTKHRRHCSMNCKITKDSAFHNRHFYCTGEQQ